MEQGTGRHRNDMKSVLFIADICIFFLVVVFEADGESTNLSAVFATVVGAVVEVVIVVDVVVLVLLVADIPFLAGVAVLSPASLIRPTLLVVIACLFFVVVLPEKVNFEVTLESDNWAF